MDKILNIEGISVEMADLARIKVGLFELLGETVKLNGKLEGVLHYDGICNYCVVPPKVKGGGIFRTLIQPAIFTFQLRNIQIIDIKNKKILTDSKYAIN